MIKVCLVRGKYLNNFEGQNYLFEKNNIQLSAVSSFFPLNRNFPFSVIKLVSPVDFPFFGREIKYLGNRLLGDPHVLFALEELSDKFDIFHTADAHYYYSYQLAKLRQKKLIKKLIMTSWESIPFNNESVYKKKQIKYFTLKNTDHFISHTNKAKNALIKEGIDNNKISVIRLGIDLTRFKPKIDKTTRSRNFVNKNNCIILFVGRLVKEKGVLDLYEAFKKVKSSKLKVQSFILKLKIIGEGPLKNKIQSLINKDKLTNSVSLEKKEYKEMPQIYQKADIFALPAKTTKTWEEQYGMVLVEAMASGLPIVAYDTGAISEVIGDAGILVKEGDKRNLFTSIKRLIEVRKLRDKLGKMGRRRVERMFDARKTAEKIRKIYENISGYSDKK